MGCKRVLEFPVGKSVEYEAYQKQDYTYKLYHSILQIESQTPRVYPGEKQPCAKGKKK
jgi:hypothetical protein